MEKIELIRKLVNLWEDDEELKDKEIAYGCDENDMSYSEVKKIAEKDEPDEGDIWLAFDWCVGAFYYGVLNFCGCGIPEATRQYILKFLNCFVKTDFDSYMLNREKFVEDFGVNEDDWSLYEFLAHWVDSMGWSDHGISVYSEWLTDKGGLYRELLRLEATPNDG